MRHLIIAGAMILPIFGCSDPESPEAKTVYKAQRKVLEGEPFMLNDFKEYEIPLENSSTVPTIWFIEQMSAPNVITKAEVNQYIGKSLVDGLDPSEFLTKDHLR
jgi:hypothetical protein